MSLPIVSKATIDSTAASMTESPVTGVKQQLLKTQPELYKFVEFAAKSVIGRMAEDLGITTEDAFWLGFTTTYQLLQRQAEANDLEESMG